MKYSKVKFNGLTIGVDWISFTIHGNYMASEVIEIMGLDLCHFQNMPHGSNGYKRMLKYENISVLYDGSENMGIHVNVTGSSIGTLLESYSSKYSLEFPFDCDDASFYDYVLWCFCGNIRKIGHFTRIDISIDDYGANYYKLDEIAYKLTKGKIVSKWRKYKNYLENSISDNAKIGHTIYFGSRESDILMRIYDKQLERNKDLDVNDANYVHKEWVRWELEMRKERADAVVDLLINGHSLSQVAFGVLSNYFRIINLDNANKSRCSSESKWVHFVENVEKLRITVAKTEKTLDEELEQFIKQQGRKISKLTIANGGDVGIWYDIASRYECKLTMRDREQLGLGM